MVWLAAATALLNTKGGAALAGGVGSSLSPAPAGPSSATGGAYGSGQDNSGWNVNFSGVQSASSAQDKSGGVPGLGVSGAVAGVPWWIWAALAGAVVWRMRKSTK